MSIPTPAPSLISGRVGLDRKGWIEITPSTGTSYVITPSTMATDADCFEWCRELSRKAWVTPDMLLDLVRLLADARDKQDARAKARNGR